MPRSLYGRAALILIVPVVTLQIGVSLVFIQRHFEGVTQQLTSALVLEFKLIQNTANDASTSEEALIAVQQTAQSLNLSIDRALAVDMPDDNLRRFFDITGITVIRSLEQGIPDIGPILLPNDWQVETFLPTKWGIYKVSFTRFRVSAPNPHQLIVWTIGLGMLMVLISYLFLRNQLRPIRRLSLAAEAFGKGRHLPYRPSGAYEVRSAGNAFLEMRARIERHIEQRTLMLSGVSHDLRSPLTRLKLALSMSESNDSAEMMRDVEDMQRLLDEFLAFARRDADAGIEAETVDPVQLVEDLVSEYVDRSQPVELVNVDGSGLAELRSLAVKRALENLINNALNYGECAEVSITFQSRNLVLSVEDKGPGILEKFRDEALKPFARLEPARNQNQATGVGLGLSIAMDIARAHGGRLRLGESERLGGLKAELVLPLG